MCSDTEKSIPHFWSVWYGCWLLILILVLMLLLLQNMNNGFACSCRSTSVHCMNYIMKTNFKRNLWCSNFVASVFISLLFAMYTLRETCSFMSVRVEWQAYSSQFTAGKKPYSSNEFVWFCCQAFATAAAAAVAAVVAVFLCSLLVYSFDFRCYDSIYDGCAGRKWIQIAVSMGKIMYARFPSISFENGFFIVENMWKRDRSINNGPENMRAN